MKVLVTGANGFIGSHLGEHLLRSGHEVTALVRERSDLRWLAHLSLTVIRGSLYDPVRLCEIVRGMDHVYHVAGATRAPNRAAYLEANHHATYNLLNACRKSDPSPRRLLYVSSLAAAGPAPPGRPRTERDPPAPLNAYGESKRRGEQEVESYMQTHPATIVRPPVVFGPRDKDSLLLFQSARRGVLPACGLREKHFSLVYVEDLVAFLMRAAEEDRAVRQTYYVSDGKTYAWSELARALGAAVGRPCRSLRLPVALWYPLAAGCEAYGWWTGHRPLLNFEKLKELRQRAWTLTPAKAQRELGYTPRYALEEALRHTAAWYRSHEWL